MIPKMRQWKRRGLQVFEVVTVFVILCVAGLLWLSNARSYQPVGGGWYSATNLLNIIDSGRQPRYLVRGHLPFSRHQLAESITHIVYLGDDCVAYTFVNGASDDLYAACGNYPPVFLYHVEGEDYTGVSIDADPLVLRDKTVSVTEVKRRATQASTN
jgi:hypothetical protein